MPAALVIAFTFALIFTAGCSNDEIAPPETTPPRIDVSGILCNPLSPAPGDTARLTVRAEGEGAGAKYEWQVEAGTLIGSNDISVEWEVPADPGVYTVMVRASVGSEVRMDTAWVMVRRCEAIATGLKYAFYPNLIGADLYLVGTNAILTDRTFLGYHAYKRAATPVQIDKLTGTPNIGGGYDFRFLPDGVLAASVTDGAEYIRQQPTNVIYYPYNVALSKEFWSNNEITGTTFRKNQNIYPNASSNRNMIVWQRNVVGMTDDGKKDLDNLRFRHMNDLAQTLTTAKDSIYQYGAWNFTYWRNIKPMFSPDGGMIVYFNDSTETFEPCFMPMNGTVPNVGEQRALMVDSRHGIFFYAGVQVSEKTIFQWNPSDETKLAFIDDKRQFCVLDCADSSVSIIGTGLTEFVYSEDGKLAGIGSEGVYVLEPGQTEAKLVFAKERLTDAVIGVNWSPGLTDQKLAFRMVRKGASSIESFSVIVIYSMTDDRWYYASPEIKPVTSTEPAVNYIWMRAIFDPVTGDVYVPVPLSEGGGKSVIYRSY